MERHSNFLLDDMRLLNCEFPQRIYNKYSKEFVYVPCGKCPSCLKRRSNVWIERLNVERKCWKYCVFFTLTYSPDHVPYLEKLDNLYLADLTHSHTTVGMPAPLINLQDLKKECSPYEWQKCVDLMSCYDKIPYLSIYDVQLFIKRLRKNLKNRVVQLYGKQNVSSSDYLVRYFVCGEYGPTTKRCHYHGLLFFSSEQEASCIEECISKSWKFGITDSSFVEASNASYVASYVNCNSDLPKILQHKSVRPFAVYSKCPPLGTLYRDDEEIRKIFDNASPRMFADYIKQAQFVNVPLWRVYKDRLFPKIAGFSKFSNYDRTLLYGASIHFEGNYNSSSASDFAHYMLNKYESFENSNNNDFPTFNSLYLHCYHDYISYLFDGLDAKSRLNSLMRWYFVSARVCRQADIFGINIVAYVRQIERFYENVEKEKLNLQFNFEEDYTLKFGSTSLLGLDLDFLNSVLDVPKDLLSAEEMIILDSYGIDLDKFCSDDLEVRLSYQSLVLPEYQVDYLHMLIDNVAWQKKKTKTKIKNDYLESHPELSNFKLLTKF